MKRMPGHLRYRGRALGLCALLALVDAALAQEETPDSESDASQIRGSHERTGFEVGTRDGRYLFHLWFRGQLRASHPFDDAPRTPEQFDEDSRTTLDLNRARIKIEGHAYQKWADYYIEYDLPTSNLLDFRITLARFPWAQVRVGQWKVNYTRERVDSSGAQQFVDRSIVNREFTVDRQQGLMLLGHLWENRAADSWYYFGVFNGNGANASSDDNDLMWLGRLQWNFLGRDLKFSQSDIERHEKPAGSIAVAAVRNRSPFTRFSSDGGGDLDGFDPGVEGQYDIEQIAEEFAFKYRGVSVQQEFHWKTVDDRVNGVSRDLQGAYFQVGTFPNEWISSVPAPLEIAMRYAFVDPDDSVSDDRRDELILAANWFFARHDNKLTLDVSRLTLQQPAAPTAEETRVRFQWDISF